MTTKKNVIVLTAGLAGSSVLTSLLAKAGYWTGNDTVRKSDYNTWENSELVSLNRQILTDTGFTHNWLMEFREDYIDSIVAAYDRIDPMPMQAFVAKCNEHAPWLWKDPRLWLTIRYWVRFLDLSNTVFLVVRRELLQAWISTTIRRQIQTMDFLDRYNRGIERTIMSFVRANDARYVSVLYEDLICEPESVIARINDLTSTELTVDDFKAVFRGKLYRKQHGAFAHLKARAIYFKNYAQRYK